MKRLLAAALTLFVFWFAWVSPLLSQGVDPVIQVPDVFPGVDGGRQMTALEATQVFWDDFGTGTIDSTNRWSTPTTGGGGNAVAATNAVGATVLSSGTSASGFSLLTSQPTFAGRNPGYVTGQWQVNIEAPPVITGAYRAWGFFTNPGTPTLAAPLSNAVVFAIDTNGKLRAQTWASGTININIDLSIRTTGAGLCNCIGQPTDSAVHKYQVNFRGDNILWWVDGKLVAKVLTGAGGPDVNTLPTAALAVVGTSAIATAATVQLNQVTIGDTSRNNVRVCDGLFSWRCAPTAANITGNASGTTGAVVGTLVSAPNKLAAICGVNVSAIGGTAAVGPVTVSGIVGSSFVFQGSASAAGGSVVSQTFTPCVQASSISTNIITTTTADGTATAVNVNSWGILQ